MFRSRIALAVLLTGLSAAVGLAAPLPKSKETPKVGEGVPVEAIEGEPVKLAAARQRSSNNLKQLALALHNYHDTTGKMPQDIVDKDGKPLLSWRVHLLPYMEQDDVHRQFKLDEPWDSTTNKALLEKMPKILESPRVVVKTPGHTVYQGFAGPGTIFERGIKPLTLGGIPDGTSNTIFAIEASVAVPWTKPIDIPFDRKADLPDLGKGYAGVPLVALLDGSVRVIDMSKVSAKTLKAAIGKDDGEVMGPDW